MVALQEQNKKKKKPYQSFLLACELLLEGEDVSVEVCVVEAREVDIELGFLAVSLLEDVNGHVRRLLCIVHELFVHGHTQQAVVVCQQLFHVCSCVCL